MTAALLVGVAAPAAADCAGFEESIDEYQTLFVARAQHVGTRTATLEVEEVWRGIDLAPTVRVVTTSGELVWPVSLLEGVVTFSSIDAELAEGETYLVGFPRPGSFQVSGCDTAPMRDELRELAAPQAPRPPMPGAEGGASFLQSTEWVGALVLAVLLGSGVYVWRMSRRARPAGSR